MAKVKHVRISAMLSGLKLEATLQNVNASATHRERVKGVLKRKSHETSATAHVGHAMIVLLEGEPPNMQYVSYRLILYVYLFVFHSDYFLLEWTFGSRKLYRNSCTPLIQHFLLFTGLW